MVGKLHTIMQTKTQQMQTINNNNSLIITFKDLESLRDYALTKYKKEYRR